MCPGKLYFDVAILIFAMYMSTTSSCKFCAHFFDADSFHRQKRSDWNLFVFRSSCKGVLSGRYSVLRLFVSEYFVTCL